MYGFHLSYANFLGSVKKNSTGYVTSAKAILTLWHIKVDDTQELAEEGGAGLELDLADKATLDWEKQLIQVLAEVAKEAEKDGVTLHYNAARR